MPGRDGTGPLGQGAMTGGGLGDCASTGTRGYYRDRFSFGGRGGGMFGRGRGFRNRFFAMNQPLNDNASLVDEKQNLNNELQYLEQEINSVKNRLNEIESK
jgi:hypothetical protein